MEEFYKCYVIVCNAYYLCNDKKDRIENIETILLDYRTKENGSSL